MMYPQYNNQYQQQPYQQVSNGNYYGNYNPGTAQQAQAQMPNQLTIQNGGFVSAPNVDYVLNYPVAHGNCITFKLENQPIVMEKSLGFSQLEAPIIKRYRLVEEEATEEKTEEKTVNTGYDDGELRTQINDLKTEIVDLKKQIKSLQGKTNKKLVKQILVDDKEEEEDQDDSE